MTSALKRNEVVPQPHPPYRIFIDLTGQTYGRLSVLAYAGKKEGKKTHYWYVECSCGTIGIVASMSLRSGDTQSCGCLQKETVSRVSRETHTTHGKTNTHIHRTWRAMWNRCTNPNYSKYHRYGGRGIKICERWQSFLFFEADMGPRPSPQHSIERINNNGDYCPENCRWATVAEQNNNRGSSHNITHDGRTQNVTQWARELGISRLTITGRIRCGFPVEEIFNSMDKRTKEANASGILLPKARENKSYDVSRHMCDMCSASGTSYVKVEARKYRIKPHSCMWPIRDKPITLLWLCPRHGEKLKGKEHEQGLV